MAQRVSRQDEAARQRRKSRNRKIIFCFFIFVGIVIFLESPATRVRQLQVDGNHTIAASKLLADSPLHTGMSLWQVNAAQVAAAVMAKEPLIQAVAVHTDIWQGLVTLSVTEKHIVAIYETNGKFYNLLNDGTVFQSVSSESGLSFPLITAPASQTVQLGKVPSMNIHQLCQQLTQLPAAELTSVSEIHDNGDGTVNLFLNNGFVASAEIRQLANALPGIAEAVRYFVQKGYAPGVIDMTGPPPYRYTPFAHPQNASNGSKGGSGQ